MKEYTCSELGMLIGAGIGGTVSIVCFTIWNNMLFFVITGFAIAAGIFIGSCMDKRHSQGKSESKISGLK